MVAANKGHERIVRLLLEHSADANAKIHNNNGTALILAAILGHEKVVKVLLKNSDVNAKTYDGSTALILASGKDP